MVFAPALPIHERRVERYLRPGRRVKSRGDGCEGNMPRRGTGPPERLRSATSRRT
ncbi:MAG: hypothetical protein MZU84_09055 [Sphingobacterium sp.]|nr:hypothetical protein [Sphingobacterium sp.]